DFFQPLALPAWIGWCDSMSSPHRVVLLKRPVTWTRYCWTRRARLLLATACPVTSLPTLVLARRNWQKPPCSPVVPMKPRKAVPSWHLRQVNLAFLRRKAHLITSSIFPPKHVFPASTWVNAGCARVLWIPF